MSELKALVEAARRAANAPLCLATVVDIEGSAYRQPGARMLFTESAWLAGSVSGGCLERDLLTRGFWRTRDSGSTLVRYDSASEERQGTGCDGAVHVLLQRLDTSDPNQPIRVMERCLQRERSALLLTVVHAPEHPQWRGLNAALFGSDAWSRPHADPALREHFEAAARVFEPSSKRRSQLVLEADVTIYVERIEPPPHLFVFGTAHDAVALVTLAKQLGFSVSVCSPDGLANTRARFRIADRVLVGEALDLVREVDAVLRPLAVVMSHHYQHDLSVLRALVGSRAEYIGVLGAARRAERMLEDLQLSPLDPRLEGRLHAPVGLQIGAEDPAGIALSILAEAQCVLSGASGRPRGRPDQAVERLDGGAEAARAWLL